MNTIALREKAKAATADPVMDAFNRRTELRLAAEKMPEPTEEAIAYGAHVLSEWLDDAAPLHERRYRDPARAVLKFAASLASSPADPTALALLDKVERLERERDEAVARADACERQAVQWKGEAMAHKSSLHEAYQVLTGATGEPANWNGARPLKHFKEADQQAFVEWLRAWVRMKFGKIITFQTAYGARMSFNAERSQLLRETLAATSILSESQP